MQNLNSTSLEYIGNILEDLNVPSATVLSYLLKHASLKDNTISATLEEIANNTGLTLSTVNRHMADLKKANYCKLLKPGKYMLNPEKLYYDSGLNEKKYKQLMALYQGTPLEDKKKYNLSVQIDKKCISDGRIIELNTYGFKVKDLKEACINDEVCRVIINIFWQYSVYYDSDAFRDVIHSICENSDLSDNAVIYFGVYDSPPNDFRNFPSIMLSIFFPSGNVQKIIYRDPQEIEDETDEGGVDD